MKATEAEFLQWQQEAKNENTSGTRLIQLAQINLELQRLVTLNPAAPPGLLGTLSKSPDAATRQHVARNPNTPMLVLWNLGVEFPQQLLDNPIFFLLLLENPNLVEEIPKKHFV